MLIKVLKVLELGCLASIEQIKLLLTAQIVKVPQTQTTVDIMVDVTQKRLKKLSDFEVKFLISFLLESLSHIIHVLKLSH